MGTEIESKLVTDTNWSIWCRLCAKQNNLGFVDLWLDDKETKHNLINAINKFFQVNITKETNLPKTICNECHTMITIMIGISDRVDNVQRMFLKLQDCINLTKEYLDEVRHEFDVTHQLEEHQHFSFPEVHYFEVQRNQESEESILNDEIEIHNPLSHNVSQISDHNVKDETDISDVSDEKIQSQTKTVENTQNEADSNEYPVIEEKKNVSKRNAKRKSNSSVYHCTVCPRRFRRFSYFQLHMKHTHQKNVEVKALQCQQCFRDFQTEAQLERHKDTHELEEKKKVLPCPHCDKKFTNKWSMRSHIKNIHSKEHRRVICEECGVSLRSSLSLKSHMLTHTDDAPFECECCKKHFKDEISLRKHMEIHNPNKYICAKCGLQLNSRATLNRHLIVHSDKMQHKCDYCGREFKRAKALKNHLILHTGLKPYLCDFCDRTFANGSNCRTHKKKSHPKELAAMEAAGTAKNYTLNIPKLDVLKAFTKNKVNLSPVVSKQSGCFSFGKKPKLTNVSNETKNAQEKNVLSNETTVKLNAIPPIDNIYNHIFKQQGTIDASLIENSIE